MAHSSSKDVSVEHVERLIKQKIKYSLLIPGQRIIEADIIAETGAKRDRVRAALRRLATEGFVTIQEFRGASVTILSRDEVIGIYQAREAIEGMAARLAASVNLVGAQRDQLGKLQRNLDAAQDLQDYLAVNEEFHSYIADISGNSYIKNLVDRLRLPVFRLQLELFMQRSSAMGQSNDAHRKITAAILDGRADEAEMHMRDHVRASLDSFLLLENKNFSAAT